MGDAAETSSIGSSGMPFVDLQFITLATDEQKMKDGGCKRSDCIAVESRL